MVYESKSVLIKLAGNTPSHNSLGRLNLDPETPLAGGFVGVPTQVRGDWQFFTECFYFPNWNAAVRMCWMCRASATIEHLFFTNTASDAGWRRTLFSHESYLEMLRLAGEVVPVLLAEVVGLRLDNFMVDTLHAVDLGIAAHILGNVLWILCIMRRCLGGRNQAECVERLGVDIKSWSRRTGLSGVRGTLTIDRVRTRGGWPKLKGKGATARHMVRYAADLIQRFRITDESHPDFEHDELMHGIVQCLMRFYEILFTQEMFLTDEAKIELPRLGQLLASMYTRIARLCFDRQWRLWKVSPKLHLWEHLTEGQSLVWGNPKFWWCYADEDLVGLMGDLASGVHPTTIAVSLLFKWLHIQFP